MAVKKKRKVVKVKAKVEKNGISQGNTGFIALNKSTRWVGNRRVPCWNICGNDIHKTAELARACGCAEYEPENVGVLEVQIIAQHKQTVAFEKEDKVSIKFND